ncbi:MAG: hypothetical protein J3R72DRAFT_455422 [Linnemannia gamsii]|nr:MAG: hypothetical protein J3R72DRAFT_455422 [Linnemannia gamsii]
MRYASAMIFFTLASVAMAKMRCMCSDDGNSINKASTQAACQGALNYGVEVDGFCYIIDSASYSSGFLAKCPVRDTSYCQLTANK